MNLGKECCAEIYPEDGRRTDGRRGDWGKHLTKDQLDNIVYNIKASTAPPEVGVSRDNNPAKNTRLKVSIAFP
jgi:hypothetical protein